MSAFLKKIESIALSVDDIRAMNPNTNVILYKELQNVKNIRDVMKDGTVIILMQIERSGAPVVGHWVAILDKGDHIEHFDSYGFDIDEELKITNETERGLPQILANEKVITSTKQLQMRREGVNTCGRWAITRTLLKNLSLEKFNDFVEQVHIPDMAVSYATMFLEPKREFDNSLL